MSRILPLLVSVVVFGIGYGITFPLIAIRLEQTGVDGTMLGLNAAMPALGWILGSILLSVLQLRGRVSIRLLAIGFLLLAAIGLAGLRYAEDYASMTALRFLFGGSMGMFLRCIEYWLNGIAADHERGRLLAVYSIALMSSIVVGSAIQPVVGASGWPAFAPPLALTLAAALLIAARPPRTVPAPPASREEIDTRIIVLLPAAYLAALVYGFAESVPTSLIQIYALRNGMGEAVAAYALSAAALGGIALQFPVLMASDRIGRMIPLAACATIAAGASCLIPLTVSDAGVFLGLLFVWGGALVCIYSLALAMLGDRFKGDRLVIGNAVFGAVYALGSVVGPLVNGAALDHMATHGMMASVAAAFAVLIAGTLALRVVKPAGGVS